MISRLRDTFSSTTRNKMSKENNLFQKILLVLLLASLVLAGYVYYSRSHSEQAQPIVTDSGIVRNNLDANTIPAVIPKDIPFINTGTVLQNTTTAAQNTKQASRVWVTDTAAKKVTDAFTAYFKATNWNITTNTTLPSGTVLSASQGKTTLSVTISQTKQSNQTKIELTAITN